MKKLVEVTPAYLVPEKENIWYESKDGKRFLREADAIINDLVADNRDALKTVDTFDTLGYSDLSEVVFYFIKDNIEFNVLVADLKSHNARVYLDGDPLLGTYNRWIGVKFEDGGDSRDCYNFIDVEKGKTEYLNIINRLNDKTTIL